MDFVKTLKNIVISHLYKIKKIRFSSNISVVNTNKKISAKQIANEQKRPANQYDQARLK